MSLWVIYFRHKGWNPLLFLWLEFAEIHRWNSQKPPLLSTISITIRSFLQLFHEIPAVVTLSVRSSATHSLTAYQIHLWRESKQPIHIIVCIKSCNRSWKDFEIRNPQKNDTWGSLSVGSSGGPPLSRCLPLPGNKIADYANNFVRIFRFETHSPFEQRTFRRCCWAAGLTTQWIWR